LKDIGLLILFFTTYHMSYGFGWDLLFWFIAGIILMINETIIDYIKRGHFE
jgi:hypothetical protein